MSWNYRVMRHEMDEGYWYGIHEVFYDEDGRPQRHSVDPQPVVGDDPDVLPDIIDRFKLALQKPVLEWHEGRGYKETDGTKVKRLWNESGGGAVEINVSGRNA